MFVLDCCIPCVDGWLKIWQTEAMVELLIGSGLDVEYSILDAKGIRYSGGGEWYVEMRMEART